LKIRKIFSGRKKNTRTFFFEKFGHTIYRKTKYYTSIQKPGQTLPKTIFSDVNSIAGNQGRLQAVFLKKPPEICVKKSDPKNAAKLQDQIAIKSAVLER
jgi:hypothetical protein